MRNEPIPYNFENHINTDLVKAREKAAKERDARREPIKITTVRSQTPAQRAEDERKRVRAMTKGVEHVMDRLRAKGVSRRDAVRAIEGELSEHLGYAETVSVENTGAILDLPDFEVQRIVKSGELTMLRGQIDADSLVSYMAMSI